MAPRTRGSADPPVRAGLAAEDEERHAMRDASRSDRPLETEVSNETPQSRAPRRRRHLGSEPRFRARRSRARTLRRQRNRLLSDSQCPPTSQASVCTVSTRLRRRKTPPWTAVGAVGDRPWWRKIPNARFQALLRASSKKRTTETRASTVAWRPLSRRKVTGFRDRARRARARDVHARARGFVAEASRRRDSRDATRLDYRLFSRRKPVGSMFLKTAI